MIQVLLSIGVLFAGGGLANAVTVDVREPARSIAEQDPRNYAGFTATEVAELDARLVSTNEELRKEAGYAQWSDALLEGRPEDVTVLQYVERMRRGLDKLRTSALFADPIGVRIVQSLGARVEVVADSFAVALADAGRTDMPLQLARSLGGVIPENWESQLAQDVKQPEGATWSVNAYLGTEALGGTLPIYAKVEPASGAERWVLYASADQAFVVRVFCDAAGRLMAASVPMEAAARRLAKSDRAWDNYLQRGYPQFPWENLVNDWFVSSAWNRPPTHQFVFVHPTPGFVFDVDSAEHAELDAALLVHALGYVYYAGDERTWFYGGSATLAVTTDDDRGLAYGLTFHCGNSEENSVIPQIDLGLLWHDGEDDDGWLLSVGFDVARLLAPAK